MYLTKNEVKLIIGRKVNFAIINQEIEESKHHKNTNTRYNKGYYPHEEVLHNNESPFECHIKRKTKQFFVGGFMPSIIEQHISNYIADQGVNVTKVVVFRNYKYDKATIRVNVNYDGNAD